MKVNVSYTVEVSNYFRLAVSDQIGESGKLATREQIKHWLEQNGQSSIDSLETNEDHGKSVVM